MNSRIFLAAAWIISIVAMSGSLFFSEVMKFIPCAFCWYQRILMYPMTWILGYATFKNDRSIIPYLLPLTIFGMLLSGIHYLQQKLHIFPETCSVSYIPCAGQYINWLGFITIPFLSFSAFTIITCILLHLHKQAR